MSDRTLYLIVSGAAGPHPSTDLARLLADHGWTISVISTPTGLRFHDTGALAEITGAEVRSEFRTPGTGQRLQPPDCVVALLSFNSLNRAALGLADSMAIAVLCEMAGLGVPTLVVPKANDALAAHPAYQRSVDTLEQMPSVRVLGGGTGHTQPTWDQVAAAAEETTA